MSWYEIVGYVASVLIALSIMMKNVLRLRIINSLGALCFVVYGTLINSWPVAGMNAFIILVNLYYIKKLYNIHDAFQLIRVNYEKSEIFYLFLDKYKSDIKSVFPDFDENEINKYESYLILRNLTPTGLFAYKDQGDTIYIYLDYVSPEYRDFHTAAYFYDKKMPAFLNKGIKKLVARSKEPKHISYLKKIGFHHQEGDIYQMEVH